MVQKTGYTSVSPYSTLGAGAIVLPTADPNQAVVSAMVMSATGKASTDGFDDINGAIFAGEGRVRTEFLNVTGHQLVGAFYSNKAYTSIDQRIEFEPLRDRLGLAAPDKLAKKDGTWAVYYNFDQFLLTPRCENRRRVLTSRWREATEG